ncbi:glycoside hydrolase family 44 protein [Paenibacillus sedimenti]|uniref:Fibronectin type III domain-containing protein n=1 Tax=Paenibacillus sedimenti TaxID=2770274 RepID=A0A926KJK5_9BACL|nr:glycoside hydrolase family 44 protein [Paenibacillus sedimenti]MBD0378947.1 fibronectin type III domain-containing protein [Paenibacillus sedimenti]
MSRSIPPKPRRMAALLIACMMMVTSLTYFGAPPYAEAAADIQVSAQAASSPIPAASTTTVQVNLTSSETTAVMIDMEIFDASLKRVDQIVVDNINVTAGEAKTVPVNWKVPASLPQGTYIISLGIFGAGWNPNINQWFAGVASVQITGGTGGEPDPQPTLPAPQQLQATTQKNDVTLTWNPVAGATAYEVETDGIIAPGVTSTSYTHSNLQANTTHTYKVRAANGTTPGAWSAPVTVQTLPDIVVSPTNGIKVAVNTGNNPTGVMLGPNFKITNTGNTPINLSDLAIRYYFTIDGEEKPLSIGFWCSVPAYQTSVITQFVKMPIPSATADRYLEISFTPAAGTLAPGADVLMNTWINKSDWSNFDQSNDYSYTGTTEITDSDKATGYVSGNLKWGTEPTLLDLPAFPSNIAASPADTSIALSWNAVQGATSYDVLADGVLHENMVNTSFVHNWLKSGTRHTYYVRSHQDGKVGVWSSAVSVKTTGLQNIPAPVNVKSKRTDTAITLTWDAPDAVITGYDIEIDGLVIDNGMNASYNDTNLTPGTTHTYRVRAKENTTIGDWSTLLTLGTTNTPNGPFSVNFSIDPSADRVPISPFIYGTNDDLSDSNNWTARRIGGNRLSTYNWENNASNSGDDAGHHSDGYVAHYYGGVPWGQDSSEPGIGFTGFHRKSLTKDAYSLVTLQTAGYVAKDKNGYVTQSETAPSSRWVLVQAAKNGPLSLQPDLNDNRVYIDEFVHYLTNKFGNASTPTGIKGYELDNEPGLWHKTHHYMHPERPKAAEVLNKGLDTAKAVKNVDSSAQIFGPVTYGFDDMHSMYVASDWPALKGNYSWYLDYYLDQFRAASAQENKRLLDVLDTHWYPETSGDASLGGKRIQDPAGSDNLATNKARLQAPRQLWDTSYTESNSWLFKDYSSFFPLIPRLQQSIDTYNPGTKLAFTEYNYGAENNIYGGIAQADVFGIYGKYGVYMANFWRMTDAQSGSAYISSALNLYTNYDGNNGTFGDTKVKAETSDIENSSIYGSVFKDSNNDLHLIVLNKNMDYDMNAVFNIAGAGYTTARVWAFDQTSSEVTERQPIADINGSSFTYTVPKLTACHIVLKASR